MACQTIHRPMVPLAGGLMIGCAVGVWFPGHWLFTVLTAAVGLAVVIADVKTDRHQLAAPLAFIAVLGYLSVQPWMAPPLKTGHPARFVDQGPVLIVGRVVDAPRTPVGRQKLYLDLIDPGQQPAAGPTHGRIRLTVQGMTPRLDRGDLIRFTARLRSPRNFGNPGGFDYRRYLLLRGVQATAWVAAEKLQRTPAPSSWRLSTALSRFRQQVIHLLHRELEPDTASVLAALTIGDRSGIDEALRNAFNRVGVGHLLAISGLHVGIVAGLVYGLLWQVFSRMPFLPRRGLPRPAAAMGTLVAVWGYALLAGLSPSTQRAALMISAYLGAGFVERERDLPNTLALAALVILLIHPPALFSVSFQLSFLAVAWIAAGLSVASAPPADPAGTAPGWPPRMARRMYQFFLVSLWATLGTLPVVMATFNQVPLLGLPANFIFVPIVGMGVVPVALTATVLATVSPPAAAVVFQIAGVLLSPTLDLMRAVSRWPVSALTTFTPRPEEIGLYYAVLGLGLAWRRWPAAPSLKRWRLVLLVLLLTGALADGFYWSYRRLWHSDVRATVLDVGQGSAAVLELPRGKVAIVDGGGFSDNRIFDVGGSVLAPFLRYRKIRTIDLVVLTHANADHLNGLLYVLAHFPVGRVWSNHQAVDTFGYRQFVDTIERRCIPWPAFECLPRRSRLGDAWIEVLHPPCEPVRETRDVNNDSIVLRVSTAHGAILLTGDVQAAAESSLVSRSADRLASEALLVPHHGSRTSSSPPLLAAVRPRDAIISCGWKNRYRMPHPEVLGRLEACGARVWRTDWHGALTVTIDADGVAVMPFCRGHQGALVGAVHACENATENNDIRQ
jgi:competence protein ComEC